MLLEQRGFPLFKFWGVEVSVSFWYLIIMGFIIVLWPAMGGMAVADGVLWALVITASLLIHDFAHAAVAKRHKLRPSIVLTAFGGFCFTDREAKSDGDDIRMVLAGPLVSLALAAVALSAVLFIPEVVASSPVTQTMVTALLWVNLLWGLVNLLLPIWPLDGGRLFHLVLRRFKDEKTAREWALKASIYTVIPVGIVGLVQFMSLLIALFAVFVLIDNVQALNSNQSLLRRKSAKSKNQASSFHEGLLEEAEEAMEAGDWREAARLAHHMRSVGSMPAKMLDEVWTILGIATMKMGEYDEALSYLKRAPQKRRVKQAIQRCEEETTGDG